MTIRTNTLYAVESFKEKDIEVYPYKPLKFNLIFHYGLNCNPFSKTAIACMFNDFNEQRVYMVQLSTDEYKEMPISILMLSNKVFLDKTHGYKNKK